MSRSFSAIMNMPVCSSTESAHHISRFHKFVEAMPTPPRTIEDSRLSIITASFNAATHIKECLRSVRQQTYSRLEHIVIDGGSTDGTLEILERNRHGGLSWISEPDSGIAEAMNKGIARARGQWLLFLQADDRIHHASAVEEALAEAPDGCGVILFPVCVRDVARQFRFPVRLGRSWRKMPGSHQGMLFHRTVFERHGTYDTSYQIAMDYAYVRRLERAGVPFRVGTTFLATVSGDGISGAKDWPGLARRLREERRVQLEFAPNPAARFLYRFYWAVYQPYRWFMSQRP